MPWEQGDLQGARRPTRRDGPESVMHGLASGFAIEQAASRQHQCYGVYLRPAIAC
jgi:hypothetical protein